MFAGVRVDDNLLHDEGMKAERGDTEREVTDTRSAC
jgi:hypothetical protein